MALLRTNMNPTLSSCEQNVEHVDEQAFTCLGHMITVNTLPMVLKAAVELDLFGIIARVGPDRPVSATEIAVHLPTTNPDAASMVDRMLHLLATHSVVTCSLKVKGSDRKSGSFERVYGLTPVAKYLLPDEDGLSLAPYILMMQHKLYLDCWNKLKDVVLEGGIAFNKAHGTDIFEYTALDPMFNEVFNKAMLTFSMFVIKKILNKYEGFENVKQLVDVGGSLGHIVHAVVSKYPSIRGINFDLPHVIQHASPYSGVEHISGNMFESVPQGDAILMKWIIHDWSDDHCIKLLKNCYAALPKGGKVIIIEGILNETYEPSAGAKVISQVDMYMMALTEGGRERTKDQFVTLANAGGFFTINFDCCVWGFWVIELYK